MLSLEMTLSYRTGTMSPGVTVENISIVKEEQIVFPEPLYVAELATMSFHKALHNLDDVFPYQSERTASTRSLPLRYIALNRGQSHLSIDHEGVDTSRKTHDWARIALRRKLRGESCRCHP